MSIIVIFRRPLHMNGSFVKRIYLKFFEKTVTEKTALIIRIKFFSHVYIVYAITKRKEIKKFHFLQDGTTPYQTAEMF